MTQPGFTGLVRQTLTEPRAAAERLMSLSLSRQSLWMALALMAILNSIVYSLSLYLSPPPESASLAMVPATFQSPLLFTIFLLGALVISVFTLHWMGQLLGGSGSLGDILVLVTWLQVLRLILQLAVVVLMLAVPVLAALLVIVASVWGIVILVAFIDAAHRFDSTAKAAGVLIAVVAAMVIGLSIILSVIAAGAMGVS